MMDTLNNKWSQIEYTNSPSTTPMKKRGHGMISFTSNKKECLLIIGGAGPTPTSPSNGQYIPSPSIPNYSYTNEVHSLCLSSSPCSFTVPMVTGTPPPPTAYFSLHNIHLHNKAIMFGGLVYNGNRLYCTNDSYILTVLNDQVEFQQLQYSSVNNCPIGRNNHASTVITTGNDTSYLLVIGGLDNNNDVLNDCWVLNIVIAAWRKINLPDYVSKRYDHSISCLTMTDNSVWVVVNGGCNHYNKQEGTGTIITDINTTVLVQLVYSNNDWIVASIYNSEQLIEQRVTIHSNLIQQIVTDQLMNKTINVSDVITTIQSTNTSRTDDSITRKEVTEEKEEIKHLKSDLILLKQGYMLQLLNKEKELKKKDESEIVLRRMLFGKTQELETMKHEKGIVMDTDNIKETDKNNDESTDKLQLLLEDVDKLQNLLIEKDDELMMLKQKLTKPLPTIKEQSTQFNYMIPVNDCLDNVHVGDETVYLIQGSHTQSFNWTRWGIRMYFSDNTVASDETCEVAVKALVGGKFLFPNGSQLISAVYAISFARKLAKPVRLEIQHCALLKAESQLKYLSFVKAPMKQRIPPFEFSPLEGGSFYLDSQYGSIILDHFSLIGIIKNVAMYIYSYIPFPNSQTENEEAFDTQLSYTGQLYYTQHGNNANQWIARFMAVKDLEAFKMFIEKSYPDSVSDQTVSFSFDNDDKTLELVMNSQQDKPTTGWELLPHARPLKLLKDQMDLFGSSDCIPDPPTCMITILATPGTKTQSSLNYCIPIKGVVSVTEQICIIRLLESSSIVPSVTTPQQDQRLSSPPATTDDVPISDIINCIKGELQKSISDLTELFDTRLEKITTELLAVGLVSEYAVNSHPTSTALIKEYRAGFSFITTIVQLTERCHKFFNAMYKIRGGFSLAADTLKERINKSLMEKFNITLDL